ncbi:MAG: DUF86 domain-containing protein [Bacillota bacterium]
MNPDLIRVKHMIDAAEEILDFTSGRSRQDFEDNRMLSLSIVHLLEIIGEAANKVSPEYREQHCTIPWKSIVEMRNRLIHGYFDIDLDIVWQTVVSDIPPLLEDLKKIVITEEETRR